MTNPGMGGELKPHKGPFNMACVSYKNADILIEDLTRILEILGMRYT